MIGWIALGIVVLAILILLVVAGALLDRLRHLDKVSRRVQQEQRQKAAVLQAAIAPLRESVDSLNARMATTQERVKSVQDGIAALKGAPSGG